MVENLELCPRALDLVGFNGFMRKRRLGGTAGPGDATSRPCIHHAQVVVCHEGGGAECVQFLVMIVPGVLMASGLRR